MYCKHFGLEMFPFKTTPDPAFLCPNSQNRRALSMLRSDLVEQGPVIVVTGDVGTGKTTLILHILDNIPESMTIGLLSNFPGWADDILPWVHYAFGIADAPNDAARMEAFESFVRKENGAGRKCVLIVDEAQNVSESGLDQLLRLIDINTGKNDQFIVVLVGQTELHEKLKSTQCAALMQRVGVSVTLGPMTAAETERYIQHRLTVAGGKPGIFDGQAIAAVHRVSGGYPRLVNMVCDTAMVLAYASGNHVVGKEAIAGLGEKDGILSHVPEISSNARLGLDGEAEGNVVAATGLNPAEFEEAQLRHDIFEFVMHRLPEVRVEAGEETGGEKPVMAPPGYVRLTSGRNQESAGKAGVSGAPAGRISLRRVLGGTVAGGVVAAGAFFLAPLPLQENAMIEPQEIVSMQSAAALAPVALRRVDMQLPEHPVPLKDMSGAAFLDRALSAGVTDPAAAAIDYARAALRGEHLAAYYLGQLYETGDGVTHDLATARSWYASVEDSVRGARRRLDDLGAPVRTGDLAAPKPLLGGTLDTGGAEFVWTSGEGADPEFFVVELSDGPASTIRRLPPQEISALKLDDIGTARFWRVFAVAPDMHSYAASDWTAMGETGNATTSGPDGVRSEALVHLPTNTSPEGLAAVTDMLTASKIPYRVEKRGAGTGQTAGLQIGYYFEADADAARKIADAVGAQSAVMLAETTGQDRPGPFPGQVLILPADR